MKKITKATFKSFLRKNEDRLFISVNSTFDGMTDGLEFFKFAIKPIEHIQESPENDCGYKGVWLVDNCRNYFTPFENKEYKGITVTNCCGRFTVMTFKK